ncbi:MAG: FAD-binding protein, partial [Candidatus Omnitrophica bacterium]|nr:FAD-binding protein [Candidatus Omnitrophota bacterium]
IIEDTMIIKLVTSQGRIIGAFGLDTSERFPQKLRVFNNKTIILATGGAGEVFKINVFPEGMSGDGYALAYEAGAELVNMEFIQFGLSSIKTKLALSGSMMRALPKITNDKGEEFLRNCNILFAKGASWPISYEKPSKIIDLAVFEERAKGRKVYLDYRENPQRLNIEKLKKEIKDWYREKGVDFKREKFKRSPLSRLSQINPSIIIWFKKRGINLEREKIEIAPAAQHFQGGVRIGVKAKTNIKGLCAAGECAGGQHGANRPGGNSLLDCQVFGRIAGDTAGGEAKSIKNPKEISRSQIEETKKKLQKLLNRRRGLKASLARNRIRSIMSSLVGIVRTREGLNKTKRQLEEMKKKGICMDENGLVYLLETINILKVAKIIATAASLRDESRGPHLLFDNSGESEPRNDKKWQRYIVIKKGNGKDE